MSPHVEAALVLFGVAATGLAVMLVEAARDGIRARRGATR